MAPGFLERNLKFWGMVGVVMTALKLKDRFDDYQQLPTDEEGLGHGPVALHSPVDPEAARDLPELAIDTEIPGARPKRKRGKDCCVCCGLRCGLFWKAFGIVCLIFFVWQSVKLVWWLVTPKPTGPEGMPAYSTSLSCPADAPYIFAPEETTHIIPIGATNFDHEMIIRGNAVGTLLLTSGAADATDVVLELVVRSDAHALRDRVGLTLPKAGEASRVDLMTPVFSESAGCMRFDAVLRVPPTLRALTIKSASTAQVKFDPAARLALESLKVSLQNVKDGSDTTLLLPHAGVRADTLELQAYRGWLVGEVGIGKETALSTHLGDAVLNVHVTPTPVGTDAESDADEAAPAKLTTKTGNGRADVFYETFPGAPHRRIESTHTVQSGRTGDLYLTYKNAAFSGHVDLKARSYSASGVQGMFNHTGSALPWVGDRDGTDKITVESPTGWVGLYF